jgi:hypothetical protein
MYVCILNHEGEILLHRNMAATAEDLIKVIEPYHSDVVVAVECIFTWYWIADLCSQIGVKFVLGHALYMKAIHGEKVKNDKIDSQKIAALLRGGMLPMAYVYPQAMRSTRNLLRRRLYLARQPASLLRRNERAKYNYHRRLVSKYTKCKGAFHHRPEARAYSVLHAQKEQRLSMQNGSLKQ